MPIRSRNPVRRSTTLRPHWPSSVRKRSFIDDHERGPPGAPKTRQKPLQNQGLSTTSRHRFLRGFRGDRAPASRRAARRRTRRPVRHQDRLRPGLHRRPEPRTPTGRAQGGRVPRVFAEKKSGADAERAELAAALEFMQPGDTLVVPSLDRLSRSLQELITTVAELRRREIGFTSLHESLDTTTPGGRLVFHVFAALAEFIRELIISGTREGLAAARARGRVGGRPPSSPPTSCAPPGICCPTPSTRSPRSPSCSGSARARCTTTSPTSANSAPAATPADSALGIKTTDAPVPPSQLFGD
ncbi:recombinase family protein [Streptosporangium lutulentum]